MDCKIQRLKNILLSKLFALNVIIVDKVQDISSNKEILNITFNTNILVKYPEFYTFILEYVMIAFPDLLQNTTTISCVNSFGSSFSNFLYFAKNINQQVNYYSLKEFLEKNLPEHQFHNNSKENLLFLLDILSTEQYLQDIIDVLNKNNYQNKKFLLLLDRISEKSCIDNSLLFPIFNECDILDYYNNLNSSISFDYFSNKLANNMYELALSKKSNIIYHCNLNCMDEICNTIHHLGPHIIAIKISCENINNFHKESKERLKYLKKIYNLFLIDDKKIINEYDINFKILMSRNKSIFEYADAITIHSICGHNVMDDIDEKENKDDFNLILINKNSKNNNLLNNYYIHSSKELVKNNNNIISGLISNENIYNGYIDNYQCITITKDYQDIQSYKNNNKLFWSVNDDVLKIDNMDVMINKIETFKKIGFEHFIKA